MFNFKTNLGLTDGKHFIYMYIFLTLYEQLIIGYMPMNFYILANYFKVIREDIISCDIYNLKIYFTFSFRVSYSEILFRVSNSEILLFLFFQVSNSVI